MERKRIQDDLFLGETQEPKAKRPPSLNRPDPRKTIEWECRSQLGECCAQNCFPKANRLKKMQVLANHIERKKFGTPD